MFVLGKRNILLAIPSFLDPEIPGHQGSVGPILQLLHDDIFNEVILFELPAWRMNAFLTEQAIHTQFPNITIRRSLLSVDNLFVYKDVFSQLKAAFLDYDIYLKTHCEEPVVLLPPSSCNCLFDCWLLLTTSLDLKIRLCKIEPHYSLEGVFSKSSMEQNLDWLSDSTTEFQDVINDRRPPTPILTESQVAFLTTLFDKKENFCLTAGKNLSAESLSQFLHRYSHLHGTHVLKLSCDFIPQEICDPVLWGYSKRIENNVNIERKGLLQRLKKGWLLLLHADELPEEAYQKIISHYRADTGCHFVNLISRAPVDPHGVPVYTIPA